MKGSIFDYRMSKEFAHILMALVTGSLNQEYISKESINLFGLEIVNPTALILIVIYDLLFIVYFYNFFNNKEKLKDQENN